MDKIVKGYPNWDIPLNANIDEYNATMGNAELLTEDKTVKGAINEIKTGNDETIGKIKDDTQINTADISNLKTSVAQNTSSLNAMANNKIDKTFYSKLLKGKITKIKIISDSNSEGYGVSEHIAITPNINNGNPIIFDDGTTKYYESDYSSRCYANYFRKYISENFSDVQFINASIGGKTAKFADENKQYWISNNEDVLIVSLGTNDKYSETLEQYKSYLKSFLAYCKTKCNYLIVCTPPYASNDYTNGVMDSANQFTTDDMEKEISKICSDNNYYHISLLQGMKKLSERYNFNLNQMINIDKVHLNLDGHYIVWNVLQEYLGIKSNIGKENFHNNFKQIAIDGKFQVAQLYPTVNSEVLSPSFGTYPICDMWKIEGYGTDLPAMAHSRKTMNGEISNCNYYYRVYSNSTISNGQYILTQQYPQGIRKYLNKNEIIYVSFWARSDIEKNINCSFYLNFGTGGTPSDEIYTPGYETKLSKTWKQYTFALTVNLSNKVFGTDNNDYFKIRFTLRNDIISFNTGCVDIADVMFSTTGATPNARIEKFDEALNECLCYLEKSNEYSVLPITSTPYTYENSNRIKYMKEKLIRPKIILYSWNNGVKDNISYVYGSNWVDSNSVTVQAISTKSAEINTTISNYRYNYVIDARP